MQFKEFEIHDYKGIEFLNLKVGDDQKSRLHTLVGLNESGKTTVLEALSLLSDRRLREDETFLHGIKKSEYHSLIPKKKKGNFNGDIFIIADVILDQKEIEELREFLEKKNYDARNINPLVTFGVFIRFKDSKYVSTGRSLEYDIKGKEKGKRGSKIKELPNDNKNQLWSEILEWIDERIPPIIFYPNFLFEFPERIYIEPYENESKEHKFYRAFLQDVLDSFEEGFQLGNHLVKRANSKSQEDQEALEAVLDRMSLKISSLVFNKEFSVFSSKLGSKSIQISPPVRDPANKAHYVQIKLRESGSTYSIRERSLGFRWFFTFLLLTQFRVSRSGGKKPFFLFDEPASNLHPAAQQRLLRALENLVNQSSASVIYATHSHYLIDPRYLEQTYIVKNSALNYDNEDAFIETSTNITVEKYRSFVSKQPNQTVYFQPILDVLNYKPSNLELVPEIVMLEGKNDYYSLEYLTFHLGKRRLNLLPGGGSGSLDSVIQLYLAWGKNFIILLDSDNEGNRQKIRYLEKFGMILENRIFTLGDIDSSWSGFSTEKLFSNIDRHNAVNAIYPGGKTTKDTFNRSIQELLASRINIKLDNETVNNFDRLISKMHDKITTMPKY